MSSVQPLLGAAGRRRSPATTPGFRTGLAPRNKGQGYPADPPTLMRSSPSCAKPATIDTAIASPR
jgi:hypothetical protein